MNLEDVLALTTGDRIRQPGPAGETYVVTSSSTVDGETEVRIGRVMPRGGLNRYHTAMDASELVGWERVA